MTLRKTKMGMEMISSHRHHATLGMGLIVITCMRKWVASLVCPGCCFLNLPIRWNHIIHHVYFAFIYDFLYDLLFVVRTMVVCLLWVYFLGLGFLCMDLLCFFFRSSAVAFMFNLVCVPPDHVFLERSNSMVFWGLWVILFAELIYILSETDWFSL